MMMMMMMMMMMRIARWSLLRKKIKKYNIMFYKLLLTLEAPRIESEFAYMLVLYLGTWNTFLNLVL